MKQMAENKLDILAKRVQQGERLELGDLMVLMDSMIQKTKSGKDTP
ncbi:MAG: hypothetical protein ACAH83_10160 [Alphaproteobacteria bacterium]